MAELATVEEAAAYIGDTAAGKDVLLGILVDSTADAIKTFCHKTDGFKASTKLAHLKWVAREFTVALQGSNGIAQESISGIHTVYEKDIPEDIQNILYLDKRVIVL